MKTTCTDCGDRCNPEQYIQSPIRSLMESRTVCFSCAFWHELARNKANKKLAIDGRLYSIGPEPTEARRSAGGLPLGCTGRRFDIEFLTDGRKVTTHNLWCGSEVPDKWRSEFPDTARFINGAGEHKVGEITC